MDVWLAGRFYNVLPSRTEVPIDVAIWTFCVPKRQIHGPQFVNAVWRMGVVLRQTKGKL